MNLHYKQHLVPNFCRPKRKWIDDIKEWSKLNQSDLMVKPHDRNEWRRHSVTASSLISPTIRESRE